MPIMCNKTIRLSDISEYRNEILGIAIISIMVFHYFGEVYHSPNAPSFFMFLAKVYNNIIGSVGVDIFLFLSGFGIYHSLDRNFNMREYWKKRLKRVFLPYAIFGGIYWAIIDFCLKNETIGQFFYDYSLLAFWKEGSKAFWYISFIVVLYMLSPLIYKLGSKGIFVTTVVWLMLCVCLCYKCPLVFKNIEVGILRGPVFFLGMLSCYWLEYRSDFELTTKGLLILGTAIPINLIAALSRFVFRRVLNGVYAVFLIVIFIFFLKILYDRFYLYCHSLSVVGQYTLELYIVHGAVRHLMSLYGLQLWNPAFYAICILISIPISITLHSVQRLQLLR